jgi:hypothetical protein
MVHAGSLWFLRPEGARETEAVAGWAQASARGNEAPHCPRDGSSCARSTPGRDSGACEVSAGDTDAPHTGAADTDAIGASTCDWDTGSRDAASATGTAGTCCSSGPIASHFGSTSVCCNDASACGCAGSGTGATTCR